MKFDKVQTTAGYTYEYPRAAVTTDCVIFGFDGKSVNILLVERGVEPFKGMWALPGGFMRMNETAEECARRELREETGVANVFLEQFHTFSSVGRDPRGRVVTIAFYALVKPADYDVVGGDDASAAQWFEQFELPPLAFDHEEIINTAREYLKEKLRTKPIAFKLLNDKFSISALQTLYEAVLETKYDRRNFYRKALATGILTDEGVSAKPQSGRQPNLYSFDRGSLDAFEEQHGKGKFPFDF